MKRSPLRKISKKQTRHNLVYQKAKREYLRDNPICEACQCYESQSLHHKARRGKYLSEVKYFMATCNLCHSKIEMNPSWAREMGYLLDKFNPDNL